jgi:histidyl-tRNA synthetase
VRHPTFFFVFVVVVVVVVRAMIEFCAGCYSKLDRVGWAKVQKQLRELGVLTQELTALVTTTYNGFDRIESLLSDHKKVLSSSPTWGRDIETFLTSLRRTGVVDSVLEKRFNWDFTLGCSKFQEYDSLVFRIIVTGKEGSATEVNAANSISLADGGRYDAIISSALEHRHQHFAHPPVFACGATLKLQPLFESIRESVVRLADASNPRLSHADVTIFITESDNAELADQCFSLASEFWDSGMKADVRHNLDNSMLDACRQLGVPWFVHFKKVQENSQKSHNLDSARPEYLAVLKHSRAKAQPGTIPRDKIVEYILSCSKS